MKIVFRLNVLKIINFYNFLPHFYDYITGIILYFNEHCKYNFNIYKNKQISYKR